VYDKPVSATEKDPSLKAVPSARARVRGDSGSVEYDRPSEHE
jgi:hypothetical protein